MRYFVVRANYPLFPEEEPSTSEIFTLPIINGVETEYYKRHYTSRVLSNSENSRYLIGYLFKSIDTQVIHLDQNVFDEVEIENWQKLFFLVDTKRQLIIVEHKNNIATPENVKNVMNKITNQSAKDRGYEIGIDFLVDEFALWDVINRAEGIYQIQFKLNAPNLFGGAKKANQWLKELKQRNNMTSINVDIRNENAHLAFDNEELESYRDYADSGGGSWTLGVIENARKKKYNSLSHLKRDEVKIDVSDPRMLEAMRSSIISILQKTISKLDNFRVD